ncbi:MAG TPA: hypothetical protein VK975_01395 [Acidimicrobiales bacterium]|nr:hypothetical protein [Acidimicrobiales bacterium]
MSPSQKYEIFLQLVRQEVTMAEAAEAWQVERSRIMRIRTVAKEGALKALASSRPGRSGAQRDFELEAARADAHRHLLEGEALKEMAVKLMLVEGKGAARDRRLPCNRMGWAWSSDGRQGRSWPCLSAT